MPKTKMLEQLIDLSKPLSDDVLLSNKAKENTSVQAESLSWLDVEQTLPVWSRLIRRNTAGNYRNVPVAKLRSYDIEIHGRLWSLWGTLHPLAPVFDAKSRGKQYLACNVMACCAARIYPLETWNSQLLDSIITNGDKYYRESSEKIKQNDFEFSMENLNLECSLEKFKFALDIENIVCGKLFCQPSKKDMSLVESLAYFFKHFKFGVLQCQRRSFTIGYIKGADGGYFMFDCQSREQPLFQKGHGAAYILRTRYLQVLLYCIVRTLNVPYYNMQFTIHQVDVKRK